MVLHWDPGITANLFIVLDQIFFIFMASSLILEKKNHVQIIQYCCVSSTKHWSNLKSKVMLSRVLVTMLDLCLTSIFFSILTNEY
jgi:hypothetical protein